ncbi:MAG: Delta-9 acyl-phospholipid desaturase [Candidatus Eremiobacteraeota bacterium]|nr:Delta-9 acyl-phospholipid desaturase [Candidatus Eremiobacteraeota bacterium]
MRSTQQRKTNWPAGAVLVLIHAGALAAFWPGFFHWSSVLVMAVLMYVTGGIGIALGFHRTLTHRSVKLWKPLEYAVVTCGTLALQGSPTDWVVTHRAHHAHTDTDRDPHDSNEGFRWSHFLWMVMPNPNMIVGEERRRYAPDIIDDRYYNFLDRYQIVLTLVLAGALFAFGGLSWVVWGIFVRLAAVYQFTWLVNSAAHTIGYRSFRTPDRSTNCWWVALLGWGEGWHNNHHAFPFSARHGLRWYEFDVTWLTVKALAVFRLATDIKLPTPQMMRRLQLTPPVRARTR